MVRRLKFCVTSGLLCLFFVSSAFAFSPFGSREPRERREYREVREFREDAPTQQIALLLPMTGKHAQAAKAIKDGFLASYYKSNKSGPAQVNVRVYDTTQGDIRHLYFKALDEGANFVIGPLAKEDVYQLSLLSTSQMRAPILALNNHPQSRPSPAFVQFSLAPEDEAAQIADKAMLKGYRTASVIVPDNDWGRRTAIAFSQRWQQQGGRVQRTVYANPTGDQSAAVRRLLGVENQQKPSRHDTDIIVMAAPPEQARQWKPLFDFYYAEDIPVYATSSIYSGTPNSKLDRDMNGVIFCDMPWIIDNHRSHEMRELLSQSAPSESSQYNRLFAMGVDAYQLSRYLTNRGFNVYDGVTGNLKVDNRYHVKRELSCAQIKDGVPSAIGAF